MIQEVKLLIALALVATFISCHAAPLDESEDKEPVDNRPVIETKIDEFLFKVPVYEDKVFTEAKRKLDATQFDIIKVKLLELAKLVIEERKGYISVGKKAYGFIGLFKDFMKAGNELSKTDTSPSLSATFGPEMSGLVQDILNTKTKVVYSDKETYKRIETLMNGIGQLITKSPVGLYLDWNKLTINDELMPAFIAPIIQWSRKNGYGMILKVVGLVGGMFKNIGNKKAKIEPEVVTELVPDFMTPETDGP